MENYSNEITNENVVSDEIVSGNLISDEVYQNVVVGTHAENNNNQNIVEEANIPFNTMTMIILIAVALVAIIVLIVSKIKRNKTNASKKEFNENLQDISSEVHIQNNNEVVNNQESLSNELGFGPQINNTEVNMQPNLGINSNQLNQNINNNLQNNVEQVTTMSAIMGMENNNINVDNDVKQENNVELPTINPVNLNTNTEVNNINQESIANGNNGLNSVNVNDSLNINNTELNNINYDIINNEVKNIGEPLNVEVNNNSEIVENNTNQTVVTEESIINEANTQMPEINNILPDNNVSEVNNIEVTPVNIPVVENKVVNEPMSILVKNVDSEVVEEKTLSFNNLTENQEMLEKTSVLPNLSQININEINTSMDNSSAIESKLITLSDIVTENNNEQSNNYNIGFGDLTSISCPNCGTKCTAGDMFCVNCGSKLN